MAKIRDLYNDLYKRVVRVAHAQGRSLTESKQLALTLLPWFPPYYDSVKGAGAAAARLGTIDKPGYYGGGNARTLDLYKPENRHRLSPETLAETIVAEYIIKQDPPASKEEITRLLAMAHQKLSAEAKRGALLGGDTRYLYVLVDQSTAQPELKLGITLGPSRREAEHQVSSPGYLHCAFRVPLGIALAAKAALQPLLNKDSAGLSWPPAYLETLIEVFLTTNSQLVDIHCDL